MAHFLGICGNPDAKRLYDDLLSNYNKLVRPGSLITIFCSIFVNFILLKKIYK